MRRILCCFFDGVFTKPPFVDEFTLESEFEHVFLRVKTRRDLDLPFGSPLTVNFTTSSKLRKGGVPLVLEICVLTVDKVNNKCYKAVIR